MTSGSLGVRRVLSVALLFAAVAFAPLARSAVERRFLPADGFVELYLNNPELAVSGVLPGDRFEFSVTNRFDEQRTFHPRVNGLLVRPVDLRPGATITLMVETPALRVGENVSVTLDELPRGLTLRVR